MTLHDGMLLFVDCDIFVSISSFPLTIIVRSLQLSFCFCGLPGHMARPKKLLMDANEYCLIILCLVSLFHIDISICVCDHLSEYLIHQGIVDLECITLVVKVDPVQQVLTKLEVHP